MKAFLGVRKDQEDLVDVFTQLLDILSIEAVSGIDPIAKPATLQKTIFDRIEESEMYIAIITSSEKNIGADKNNDAPKGIITEIGYCLGKKIPYCIFLEEGIKFDLFSEQGYSIYTFNYIKNHDGKHPIHCISQKEILRILKYLKEFKENVEKKKPQADISKHQRLSVHVTHEILSERELSITVFYKIQAMIDGFDTLVYVNEVSEIMPGFEVKMLNAPEIEFCENNGDINGKVIINEKEIVPAPRKIQIPIHFDPPLQKGTIREFTLKLHLENYRPFIFDDLRNSRLESEKVLGPRCIATWQIVEPTRELTLSFKFPKGYNFMNPDFHIFSNKAIIKEMEEKTDKKFLESSFSVKSNCFSLKAVNPKINHLYIISYIPQRT